MNNKYKHIGIRPKYDLEKLDDGRLRVTYIETLPNGTRKLWNRKLLTSGCGREVEETTDNGILIYCPWCDEFCNRNQFTEVESEGEVEEDT